ncbi:response regulator [candidate division KSB1 bacterium]|nr:response regulator [candidate division KSB1 bacterium]
MTNQLILVADSDPKNLLILKENLQASGFQVITANDGNKAWDETLINQPGLILSEINLSNFNGFKLLEKLHSDPNTAHIPLIFLTNQRDVQQRVKAFQLGAKDYLVKPLHVKEVIAHIRMVLKRIKKIQASETTQYQKISGKLQEHNLADLIENFSIERKSGILTLNNGRELTGHVYFRDGIIINASLGNFSPENAIYQMLPWDKGYFNMLFKEVDDIKDVVSISNLGILLEGFKRIEQRKKYMKMFQSPETVFSLSPAFRDMLTKQKVPDDIREFISLIDGKRSILEIIDASLEDDIKTLERLSRLHNHGLIEAVGQTEHEEREELSDKRDTSKDEEIKRTTVRPPEPESASVHFDRSYTSEEIAEQEEEVLYTEAEKSEEPEQHDFTDVTADADEEIDSPPQENEEIQLPEFDRPILRRIEEKQKDVIVPGEPQYYDIEEIHKLRLDHQKEEQEEQTDEIAEIKNETYEDEKELVEDEEAVTETVDEKDDSSELKKKPVPSSTHRVIDTVFTKIDEVPKEKRIIANQERDQLLVIGFDEDGLDEVMDLMTNNTFKTKQLKPLNNLAVHFGKITESDYNFITLLGVFINKSVAPFINAQKDKLMGIIFVVDCSNSERWEYANYLIHSVWSSFHIPYSIALTNYYEKNAKRIEVMRDELNLGEDDLIFIWDGNESSVETLLSCILLPENSESQKASEFQKRMMNKVSA